MSTLRFAEIELKNWKNFAKVQVPLASRVFIVGPNASGKSNFLDAFRFLRDLVQEGGGLRKAVDLRGGLPRLRSLFARGVNTEVSLRVRILDADQNGWIYDLAFTHRNVSKARDQVPIIRHERVDRIEHGTSRNLLNRPNPETDKKDPALLTQTAIQQVTQNKDFRELADFFRSVLYLHLVPQLVREGQSPLPERIGLDQYGRDLLDRIRNTSARTRNGRLNRIQKVLGIVAAPLEALSYVEDHHGRPRLQVKFRHWRPRGAYQNETQFSDGTLRLVGLLWSLQEKTGPLLLEEPELSLHSAVVKRLAGFIHGVGRIPTNPEAEMNPKTALVNAARHSTSRAIREDLVPEPGVSALVGRGYVSRVGEFVRREWRPLEAQDSSQSLKRAISAIQARV